MYFVLKILKILFTLFRSTCFGHHCAHHQEPSQLHMQSLVPCGVWFVVSSNPAVL